MVKNTPANAEDVVRSQGWEEPLVNEMAITPVFLLGKFHGQRNLVGYSSWGPKRVGQNLVTKQEKQLISFIGETLWKSWAVL